MLVWIFLLRTLGRLRTIPYVQSTVPTLETYGCHTQSYLKLTSLVVIRWGPNQRGWKALVRGCQRKLPLGGLIDSLGG